MSLMTNQMLHDEQWKKIQTFLRSCRQVKVRSARKCRRFVEAVIWVTRSGAQWRLLPKEYGKWNSVYKRSARWNDAGVWDQMMQYFAADADMENVQIDSTIERHLVESFINKIKHFRRVFSRFDKLARRYLGFVQLANVLIWLR
jgi:transposase